MWQIIKMHRIWFDWLVSLLLIGLLLIGLGVFRPSDGDHSTGNNHLVDDWVFDQAKLDQNGYGSGPTISPTSFQAGTSLESSLDSANANLGLAVGGAKDIDNFRNNIKNDYLPSPADLSHEGIFYDYFFETASADTPCADLFCPSYATAVSANPFSDATDHFLAVGLDSNIKAEDFERKKLNLVIVLDISGSMSSNLDRYYYDQAGGPNDPFVSDLDQEVPATKMDVANRSLVALVQQLQADDRLGIVLFDDQAYLAKPMRAVSETDIEAINQHILEIEPQGGTNMEAGYREGTKLLAEHHQAATEDYENRIIFLTDAMPNRGATDEFELAKLAETNADDGIYTSFIGIGLDFNAELISTITQTQGANYFSVHSSEEFTRRLGEGFDYMVTPLVFDLSLKLAARGYQIEAVYGSPEADLASGEIIKVNTLFPSLRVDGQTRGGLILLQLKQLVQEPQLELSVSYRDRSGQAYQNRQTVNFPTTTETHFDHKGIHKGVVLSRLVNVLRDWLRVVAQGYGFLLDNPTETQQIDLNAWERTSLPLRLDDPGRQMISKLRDYFESELEALDDDSLKRELEMLDTILASPPSFSQPFRVR